MKTGLLFILSLLSVSLYAESIITDEASVNEYFKKIRENPYYLKVGLVKVPIDQFQLGKPQTPLYRSNSQAKIFFKKGSKCFELSVYEESNIAFKVKCYDKNADLYLDGFEDFKVVSLKEVISEGLKGFKVQRFNSKFSLQAYLHSYDLYTQDLSRYGKDVDKSAPKTFFTTELVAVDEVILDEKNLKLMQDLEIKVSPIGILREKSIKKSNSIKIREGGLVFSNSKGQVLIYNRTLPKPFGDYNLALNSNLINFIESLVDSSHTKPVCFRDSYVTQTQKSCHKMLFETYPLGTFRKTHILLIDFNKSKINFIN